MYKRKTRRIRHILYKDLPENEKLNTDRYDLRSPSVSSNTYVPPKSTTITQTKNTLIENDELPAMKSTAENQPRNISSISLSDENPLCDTPSDLNISSDNYPSIDARLLPIQATPTPSTTNIKNNVNSVHWYKAVENELLALK